METAVNPAVTWTELGIMASVMTVILGAVVGWAWKSVERLTRRVDDMSKRIEDNRIEVARTYATVDVVVQIEQRLTQSINRMSDQIGVSLNNLTSRVENVFSQMLKMASKQEE